MKENDIHINVNTKTGTESMHIDQYARWLCLVEAIDYIDKKCEERGANMDDVDWVKPIALQKYIDERFHSMRQDLKFEYNNGMLL